MSVRNADTDQFACLYSIIRSPPGLVNLCNAGVAKICNVTHMQWRNGARVRCCDGTKVQSINKKPSQALKAPAGQTPTTICKTHTTHPSIPPLPHLSTYRIILQGFGHGSDSTNNPTSSCSLLQTLHASEAAAVFNTTTGIPHMHPVLWTGSSATDPARASAATAAATATATGTVSEATTLVGFNNQCPQES